MKELTGKGFALFKDDASGEDVQVLSDEMLKSTCYQNRIVCNSIPETHWKTARWRVRRLVLLQVWNA
jgi:hypothetical protein